jgi:hypothetical protein
MPNIPQQKLQKPPNTSRLTQLVYHNNLDPLIK